MIFLYTTVVVVLGAAHVLLKRRAAALEKKFVRLSGQANELVHQAASRPGNSNRGDPYEAAKRQYQLALLATRRDRVEARYGAWQDRADRVGKLRVRLRGWKGKKLPYTFGALDVAGLLALADYLGASHYLSVRALVQTLTSFWGR